MGDFSWLSLQKGLFLSILDSNVERHEAVEVHWWCSKKKLLDMDLSWSFLD
jgi:hypothetical protein